jgi:hypothetical protein
LNLRDFTTQYLPPILFAVMIALSVLILLGVLARRGGAAQRIWQGLIRYRGAAAFLLGTVLFVVAFSTFLVRQQSAQAIRLHQQAAKATPSNLVPGDFSSVGPITSTFHSWITNETPPPTAEDGLLTIQPGTAITGSIVVVRPDESYRFSVSAGTVQTGTSQLQVRFLWLNKALDVLQGGWNDAPAWSLINVKPDSADAFQTTTYTAPAGAAGLRVVLTSVGEAPVQLGSPVLTQEGVRVEPHPNGARGSIAFSFDWETAMGGAVHSRGQEGHDPAAAEQHGLLMRQGADWLNNLFKQNGVRATFYATGYNLLDGNTERRTFNGDPTYKWASPKNDWDTDYWLHNPWFSDDPYGTYQTEPAWYFGDQTRALLEAGHEIASHTFAHIYVRGSNPEEMATDTDTWLDVAKAAGVPPPTTFAFPWRSSNSLTREFYDVLHGRGICAVTRIYPLDMRDLYTLGNVVVYTDVRHPEVYPDMAIMPDFLLGAPSANAGEEAGGAVIGAAHGLDVIRQTVARRGTTSFWTHPEQLGDDPGLQGVRDAWQQVVTAAAKERDSGTLWIATVAEITAYQRDVLSVTTSLERSGGSLPGGWQIQVRNDSGKELEGVTLTLPGQASQVSMGNLAGSGRQVVLDSLPPGATVISVEWVQGREPLQ